MKGYLLTIFVRFFVAFSGLVVFFVTSKLYGAEGRGVIGFGTSLASTFGLLFSFNLGRSFLIETKQLQELQQKLLPVFLCINYFLMIVGIFACGLAWLISSEARKILDSTSVLAFLLMVPHYLWSVNGTPIYATLNRTLRQDLVILIIRTILILLMVVIWFSNIQNIKTFLFFYSSILALGVFWEIGNLGSSALRFFKVANIIKFIKHSIVPHMDYLAFNLFPLVLMLIAAGFLDLSELGKLNFVVQLINFVFILSVVGSIRMKSYVATRGVLHHSNSILKLITATTIASMSLVAFVLCFFRSAFFFEHFNSFGDVSDYFLVVCLSLPGYIAYQFMYPILIQFNQLKLSMITNLTLFAGLVLVSFLVIKQYGLMGACALFSSFFLLVLLTQIFFLIRLKPFLAKN